MCIPPDNKFNGYMMIAVSDLNHILSTKTHQYKAKPLAKDLTCEEQEKTVTLSLSASNLTSISKSNAHSKTEVQKYLRNIETAQNNDRIRVEIQKLELHCSD